MATLIISVVGLLAILYLARTGAEIGLFFMLVTSLLLFLAMLVTLRYWYPAAEFARSLRWWPGPSVVFGSYWVLFLVACAPLIGISSRLTMDSQPRYPRRVETIMGGVFGLISGGLIVCCVATSLSVMAPAVAAGYDRHQMLVPLDEVPLTVYRWVETNLAGIPPDDPRHTRLPTFDHRHIDDPKRYWQ